MSHFCSSLINTLPDILCSPGQIIEKSVTEPFHFFRQTRFQNCLFIRMLLQGGYLVQLPAKVHASPNIFRTYRGISDDFRPLGMLVYPGFDGFIIIRQECFFFPQEFVSDGHQFLDDGTSFLFRDSPTRHETYSMPVQKTESTSFQGGEDLQRTGIGDTLGTQRSQVFGRKLSATEVFHGHFFPS